MISKWLLYDQSLDSHSKKEIIFLLRFFLMVIPLAAVILAAVNFSLGNYQIVMVILTVPFSCLLSLVAIKRGLINLSVVILIFVMIATTTISCILGSGVHETGMIVFPVIVLFSSLIMNVRGVVLTTFLVIISLAYIVYGEQFGLYQTRMIQPARWVDLIVVLVVTIIHIFITYSFTNITKKNLALAKSELKNQKKYQEEIRSNLDEKTELLRLVHHRVKNNLLLINSLIELETFGNAKVREQLSDVTKSIHTIARAHDPLYHSEDYKQVAVKPYLEKLISSFVQSMGIHQLDVRLDDKLIFHEKAILLGIILQRIMGNVSQHDLEKLQIHLHAKRDNLSLKVSLSNGNTMEGAQRGLIDSLVKEINGDFQISPQEAIVTFKA